MSSPFESDMEEALTYCLIDASTVQNTTIVSKDLGKELHIVGVTLLPSHSICFRCRVAPKSLSSNVTVIWDGLASKNDGDVVNLAFRTCPQEFRESYFAVNGVAFFGGIFTSWMKAKKCTMRASFKDDYSLLRHWSENFILDFHEEATEDGRAKHAEIKHVCNRVTCEEACLIAEDRLEAEGLKSEAILHRVAATCSSHELLLQYYTFWRHLREIWAQGSAATESQTSTQVDTLLELWEVLEERLSGRRSESRFGHACNPRTHKTPFSCRAQDSPVQLDTIAGEVSQTLSAVSSAMKEGQGADWSC